jgi:hypothetical protein
MYWRRQLGTRVGQDQLPMIEQVLRVMLIGGRLIQNGILGTIVQRNCRARLEEACLVGLYGIHAVVMFIYNRKELALKHIYLIVRYGIPF